MLEDLKHALRLYRRTPGSSAMAVIVLAIGLAFVASFLSLYVDLLLRPHPGFERGSPIVTFGWNDGRNAGGLPLPVVERIVEEAGTLESAAGILLQQLRAGPDRELVVTELVTREFFDGVRPKMYMGRGFTREEHDAQGEPVAVISYRYWHEQFGGRADVLGLTLEIEGQASTPAPQMPTGSPPPQEAVDLPKDFTIIGVMSPDFIGTVPPQYNQEVSVWLAIERGLPLTIPPGMNPELAAMLLGANSVRGIGRRSSGVRSTAVARELNGRFADEDFLNRPGARYDVLDGLVFNANIHRNTQRQLQLFLGASMLLALVAAANVSLFLLARAPGRRRELGIRMAVGAPLKRLTRQLASEAAVLVAAGAVLGFLLSTWLAEYLRGLSFLRQAQWRDVTLLDWRVLVLVGAFLLLVTLLVSLAPIVGLKKLGIAASSRQIAARPTAAQRVAGTAQVAIAAVLGGAAIAFAWYLGSVLFGDPGYQLDQLYAARYSASMTAGPIRVENGQVVGAVDHARRREALKSLPGVTALSLGSGAPGVLNNWTTMSLPDPQNPEEQISARLLTMDDDYVDVLGLRLAYGRNISDGDSNAVLVNQTFARRLFGRDDVVGEPFPLNLQNRAQPQIVGVLADLSYEHPLADIEPTVFTPVGVLAQVVFGSSTAIIQSALPRAALQQQLMEIGPTLEMNFASNVTSLAEARGEVLAPDRARGFLTIGTALLVVTLAGFGFYGTQRYLVTAGRREYAIRASLGAGPRALGRLVFGRGLVLGLPGLVIGLPLTFILVAWLRDDYISRAVAPGAVTVAVLTGLAALLMIASVGPARLARSTQPAPLLRED